MSSPFNLKLLIQLPEIIKNSQYITNDVNRKAKRDFDYFEYYLTDVEIEGTKYVVKSDIGVKANGSRLNYVYNSLEIINKGALIQPVSSIQEGRPLDANSSIIKDTRPLLILQLDSSKGVDENGDAADCLSWNFKL